MFREMTKYGSSFPVIVSHLAKKSHITYLKKVSSFPGRWKPITGDALPHLGRDSFLHLPEDGKQMWEMRRDVAVFPFALSQRIRKRRKTTQD